MSLVVDSGFRLPGDCVVASEKIHDKKVVSLDCRRWDVDLQAFPTCTVTVALFNVNPDNHPQDLVVLRRSTRLCDTVGRFIRDSFKIAHDKFPGAYSKVRYLSAYTYFNGLPLCLGDYDESETLDAVGVCESDWVYLIMCNFAKS